MIKKFEKWQTECALSADIRGLDYSPAQRRRRDALYDALVKAAHFRAGDREAYDRPAGIVRYSVWDTCEMAGMSYCNISSGSGDVDEFVPYFPHNSRQDLIYIGQLFYFVLDIDGSSEWGDEELLAFADEIVEEYFEGDPFEVSLDEEKERVAEIGRSFAKLSQGDMSGLEDMVVSSFIGSLCDMFEPVLDESFVACNLSLFIPVLFQASYDYLYCTHVIASEELYHYYEYRELLDAELRENIDNAIYVLSNPFPDKFLDSVVCAVGKTRVDDKSYGVVAFTTYTFPYGEVSCEEGDMSIFWQSAAIYLSETLPNLRKRYGDAITASPSFFILNTYGCAVFRSFPIR